MHRLKAVTKSHNRISNKLAAKTKTKAKNKNKKEEFLIEKEGLCKAVRIMDKIMQK